MSIVLWPGIAGAEIRQLLDSDLDEEIVVVGNQEEFFAAAPNCRVLVIGGVQYSAGVAEIIRTRAPGLQFIQLWTSGYEQLEKHGYPDTVALANAGPAWAPIVAEHAVALSLALNRKLHRFRDFQNERSWDRTPVSGMSTMKDANVLIVGYGNIGREYARMIKPLQPKITALKRDVSVVDEYADRVFSVDALTGHVPDADLILISVPYTAATHHLFGRKVFDACKNSVNVVNIARGAIVNTDDVVDALSHGRIGGYATDVTEVEPLPATSPLWRTPGALVTPHVSGGAGKTGALALARYVSENIGRFTAGAEVSGRINRGDR